MHTFLTRQVLVLMESIPKGPTGKPLRIGLAKKLDMPQVPQAPTDEDTCRVESRTHNLCSRPASPAGQEIDTSHLVAGTASSRARARPVT